jgi:hypothetical protein
MENKVQLHRPSPVNRYLEIAKQTKMPLAIYFNDGEVIPSCIILELDSINLLVKSVDLKNVSVGVESVLTRSSIKRITSALEREYTFKDVAPVVGHTATI